MNRHLREDWNSESGRALYLLRARRALLLDLLATGSATADDVWDAVPIPDGLDAGCVGAVPGPLVRSDIIQSAGLVESVRPGRHGALIHLWRLADWEAAERWLRDHPERPNDESAAF
jgi:hypothetical protein